MDDGSAELGIRREYPMVSVAMEAWRWDEANESSEKLEGREHEFRATIRCRLGYPTLKRTRIGSLTGREVEVLVRIADGNTNREIGKELGISPRTVETHRERVMAKLRVRTVAGLTRLVVGYGLGQT